MVTLFPLFVNVHVHVPVLVYVYIYLYNCVCVHYTREREREREGGGCYSIGLSMSACIRILLDIEYLTYVYLECCLVVCCLSWFAFTTGMFVLSELSDFYM